MMSNATKRSILRWIHLIFAIPILGYIYSPFEEIPNYAPAVRFVFVPVIILAGYWMYAGAIFMSQRLVRAKTKIRDAGIPFRVPDPPESGNIDWQEIALLYEGLVNDERIRHA
jgi:hypothetical protein